jgi:protein-disulfide isomerase
MLQLPIFRLLAVGCLLSSVCLGQAANAPSPSDATQAASANPNASPFPPVDPANFTASTPTKDTVDAFLKAQIGYDSLRMWQVNSIRKTIAPGFSEVTVLVAAKGSTEQPRGFRLLITPDQKFAIQDSDPVPFGANPFADARALLEKKADGPSRGAKSNDLVIVEFSDLECPHCKAEEPVMDKLLRDYPTARIVYQNFPLTRIHPWAHKAAAYGDCVAQQSNDLFFKFVSNVFASQEQTTESNVDDMLNAAATKAGADAAKAAACAVTPATLAKVDASVDLATELGVTSTPTLYINGRPISMGPNVTYELLQQIIAYQAEMDGVKLPPTMTSLPK